MRSRSAYLYTAGGGLCLGILGLIAFSRPEIEPAGTLVRTPVSETNLGPDVRSAPNTARHNAPGIVRDGEREQGKESPPPAQPVIKTSGGSEFETVFEKSRRLGRQLDGKEYREAWKVFRPGLEDSLINSPKFNPSKIELTPTEKDALKNLTSETYSEIQKINHVLAELETEALQKAWEEGYAERLESTTGDSSFKTKPGSEFEVIRTIVTEHGAGILRFSPGTHPERDSILVEATNVLGSGEERVVSFFVQRQQERASEKGYSGK